MSANQHHPHAAAPLARREASASPLRFWATAYTLCVLLVGTNIPTPLYHAYAMRFGFTPLVLTLIFSVYVGTLIPTLILGGSLSDAWGRRRVIVPAIVLAAAGTLGFCLAANVAWLFAARALQGLALGAASGPLTAALSETEPRGRRHRAALVSTLSSLGGLAIGPLLSGLIAQYTTHRFVLPYLIEIGLLLVALIAMSRYPDQNAHSAWKPRRPSVPSHMRAAFIVAGSANFLAFAVIGLFLALVPSYTMTLAHTSNLAIAGASATLMLGCSMAAQVGASSWESTTAQLSGAVLLPIGMLALAAAGERSSLGLLLCASVFAGLGHGLIFLGGLSQVNRLAPTGRHADVISTFYILVYAGVGLPVIGIGLIASHLGILAAMRIFVAVMIPLCIAEVALIAFKRRRPSPRRDV